MKLTEFSITHFRSITKAERIPISQNTVIVGPNNEGKSNILNAIAISMSEINRQAEDINDPNRARRRRMYARRSPVNESTEFFWSRDYPLSKQEKRNAKEQGRTKFRLTFALNEDELKEFKEEIGSNLNGQLEVELSFGFKIDPEFRVIKRGPQNAALAKKRRKIASFLGKRLSVNYIPAVRTEEHSLNVIHNMIRSQLRSVEKRQEYQEAIETIQNLQQPVLEALAQSVTQSMQGFIPQVRNVDISGVGLDRIRSAVQPDVQIDDGTVTPISQKGDGIKSLAAISLLHKLGVEASGSTVLLVEEPETHLHSGAIHRLRRVLEDLSLEQQVIITTHHPIFANRIDVSGNVIVRANAAKPAKRIYEVRDVLGVHASENLQNANMVLLVEGEDDKIILESIVPTLSLTVRQAISQGFLVIHPIRGASKLRSNVDFYSKSVCEVLAFLDDDHEGRNVVESATQDNVIEARNVSLAKCQGQRESELEDCFSLSAYSEAVNERFSVDLSGPCFRGNEKWSSRAKACFDASSRPWNARIESELKLVVARAIARNGERSLDSRKGQAIHNLVALLDERISRAK